MFLDFQQKNRLKKFLYSKLTIFILFVIMIFVTYSTFTVYLKMNSSSKQRSKIENEAMILEAKNHQLEIKISSLETKSGLEREIRDKFAVAKEGEKAVVIIENISSSSIQTKIEVSFWQKVKVFLGLQDSH